MVKKTERGWAGHYILSQHCLFRRNTLLEKEETRVVVSTVGMCVLDNKLHALGLNRYYETMVFLARFQNGYWDADVTKQIEFDSPWYISEPGKDNEANNMHEAVVAEIEKRLEKGETFKEQLN